MPSKQYINSTGTYQAFALLKVVMVIAVVFCGLSACSSTANIDDNDPKKLEGISLEDNDVNTKEEVKISADTVKGESKKIARIPAKNLYVEQQKNQPLVVPENVRNDYQQAINLMNAKEWAQAEVLLDQVILNQPNLSGAYVNKAIIAKQREDFVQAQLLLNKAIEVNSLNLYAHHLQGQIYRLQGQFEKAEQSYLAALAIWPDFAEVHASMAILLELYRGRLLEAYAYYHSYLAINSDDAEVRRWLAGLEIKIKRAGLTIPTKEQVITAKEIESQSNG